MGMSRRVFFHLPILFMARTARAEDWLGDFRGAVTVMTGGRQYFGAGLVTDMPGGDFINRFRLEICVSMGGEISIAEPFQDKVTVSAVQSGQMLVRIRRWGSALFLPAERDIREQFRQAYPGSETRQQLVTMARLGDGIEILIEEPK